MWRWGEEEERRRRATRVSQSRVCGAEQSKFIDNNNSFLGLRLVRFTFLNGGIIDESARWDDKEEDEGVEEEGNLIESMNIHMYSVESFFLSFEDLRKEMRR